MKKILIANGVNLDLLGRRPSQHYGQKTLSDLEAYLSDRHRHLENLFPIASSLSFFQSNDEGMFLTKLSQGWDGIVLNPGAWTHTSLALADRLEALQVPFAEVHLSHLKKRESFRQHSYSSAHALGVIYGFGLESYFLGLCAVLSHLGAVA